MDDIKDFLGGFTKLENYNPVNWAKWWKECSASLEFSATAMVAILIGSTGAGTFASAVLFSLVYALFNSQFGHRARANPVLSFADWLCGQNKGPWESFLQICFQCLGWTFGSWLCGVIGASSDAANAANGSFSSVVVQELVASGFLCWLWMSIHDDDSNTAWSDFQGLAVGIALWVAYAVKSAECSMNPAQFFGAGIRFGAFKGEADAMWLVNFTAPFFAAFVATLVYRWNKN